MVGLFIVFIPLTVLRGNEKQARTTNGMQRIINKIRVQAKKTTKLRENPFPLLDAAS